jgi:hypothetical protein
MMAGAVIITENGMAKQARVGDIVRKDAMITTGEASFAQVSISGSMIQVYEKSSIILSGLVRGESGAEETTIRVGEGTIFSRVKKIMSERGDSFSVQSCTMVAAVRGTEFLYTVDCSKGMVATFEGEVGVRNTGGLEETRVPAGRMLSVETGKKSVSTPIPGNFRYRDFVYKKQSATEKEASGAGSNVRGAQGKVANDESAEGKLTERAADKKKEGSGDSKETAVATKTTKPQRTKGGTMSEKTRTTKPGGLLDKPRMNLPELK